MQVEGFSEEYLLKVASNKFGIDSFRGLQLPVIQSILSGKPTLVVFPTGGGKSLTYQLPSQLLDGLTLVITPLISLMQDQTESLHRRGIHNADYLASTQTSEEKQKVFDRLRECSLLYISPERVQSEAFRKQLHKNDRVVRLIVVDEAHCVSTWGLSFRSSYRQLFNLKTWFPNANIMALTATATPLIKKDILRVLKLKNPAVFEQPSVRKNIEINIEFVKDSVSRLKTLLQQSLPTVIYTRSRYRCERLSYELKQSGFSAAAYHAGLESEDREHIQKKFIVNEISVLVATTAFGMGVDKSDVRRVIHLQIPNELEEYMQEIGRAGRDGNFAQAWFLIAFGDFEEVIKRSKRAYPAWKSFKQAFGEDQSEFQDVLEHYQDLFSARDWKIFRQHRKEYHTLKQVHWRKLEIMLDFIGTKNCRSDFLSRYFGFVSGDCGVCDVCKMKNNQAIDISKDLKKILNFIRSAGMLSFHELRQGLQGRDSGFLLYPHYGSFCGVNTATLMRGMMELLNQKRIRFILFKKELFLKAV